MIFRSPHPDLSFPSQSLTDFVFGASTARMHEPALVDAYTGRRITYGELRQQVRCVAAGLADIGVRKGDVVALWLPNCPEFAVVFHAIARLGAIVTPANPAYTSSELAFQLRDAGAKLLVTTAALLEKARAAVQELSSAIDLITIDGAEGARSLAAIARDADPPATAVDAATDVVVLPYSSGTTGLPKGVLLTHRNLIANILQIDAFEPNPVLALVAVLPFFHIYGMVVVLNFGLMRGATIVTMPRFELELFLKVLQEWPIADVHIVPPIALALAKHPALEGCKLGHLRSIFSGAAPLGSQLSELLQKRLNVIVRQGYGMTEASPVTHCTSRAMSRLGKVGLPVANTECRTVCPETGRDADVGQPGEVWIRGPQVMKGYLNNPEATARALNADGWLRTGDIGVVDGDGYLAIVDRLKELIKVKGFQVAPAELESLLLRHPHIADAAVIPVPDDESGEVPKAIVVARGALTAEDVMTFVNSDVAHYKRIRQVAFVAAIPRSAAGKILRRVLVERERTA